MSVAPLPGFQAFRRRVNGIILEGVEGGPAGGPLCILLHGFPEFWWGWRHQLEPLAAAGFRVIAPDQRGYHRSSKPVSIRDYRLHHLGEDIVSLIEASECREAFIVGHDWGGVVAWWVAARQSDRVSGLVVLNAPHPDVIRPYLMEHPTQLLRSAYVPFFQLPFVPEALLRAFDFALLKQALRRTSRPGTFPDKDLEIYANAWREPGALTAMLNWYRAVRYESSEAGVVPVRTLVLWGERDEALQSGLASASLNRCRDGTLRRFPDATHWLQLEEPKVVTAAIVEFFEKATPPRAGGAPSGG
jgi:pimeloyl-ACP methyl ester carboxylesterase